MKKPVNLRSILTLLTLIGLVLGSILIVSPVSSEGVIIVNTFDDEDENNELCSLREAINAANLGLPYNGCKGAKSGPNTIMLSPGTYTLSLGYQLAINSDISIRGDLSIIEASTCNPITLPGNCVPASYRILSVTENGQLKLEGITLRHGKSEYPGGAIFNQGSLILEKSTIQGNTANFGGGIANLSNNATVILDNVTIFENNAEIEGGGIYNQACDSITIENQSIIIGNAALLGGGISNEEDCKLHVTNSEISENHSSGSSGGGVNNHGELFLTGSAITENTTVMDGGGIRNGMSGVITIDTTDIFDNQADGRGGGIFNISMVTLTNSNLFSNTAAQLGGGVFTGGQFDMIGGEIKENSAKWNGGGLYMISGISTNPDVTTLTNVALLNNDAKEGRGGGVYVILESELNLVSSNLEGNLAYIDGGGIYNEGADLNILFNSYIHDNHAQTGNGGGIFNGGVATMDDTELESNSAKAGSGGGIFNTGRLTIEKSFIRTNQAVMGGGISQSGQLNMDSCTVIRNTASNAGGGIFNSVSDTTRGDANLKDVYFIENEVTFGAGGAVNNHGDFSMQGGSFTENIARGEGGGIYNAGLSVSNFPGILTLTDTTFTANLAQLGGGISNSGELELKRTTLSANATAITHGGGVLNTESGRGVFFNSTFSENTAQQHGGGVANFGLMLIAHCTFYQNDAREDGGGIYNSGAASELIFRNSILAGSKKSDCFNHSGTVSENYQNLIIKNPPEPNQCGTPINPINAPDPMLGKLADNGGVTFTHALLEGSPAIDAIDPADNTCLDFDQRGVRRPQGAGCDVGAFELEQDTYIFLPLILR